MHSQGEVGGLVLTRHGQGGPSLIINRPGGRNPQVMQSTAHLRERVRKEWLGVGNAVEIFILTSFLFIFLREQVNYNSPDQSQAAIDEKLSFVERGVCKGIVNITHSDPSTIPGQDYVSCANQSVKKNAFELVLCFAAFLRILYLTQKSTGLLGGVAKYFKSTHFHVPRRVFNGQGSVSDYFRLAGAIYMIVMLSVFFNNVRDGRHSCDANAGAINYNAEFPSKYFMSYWCEGDWLSRLGAPAIFSSMFMFYHVAVHSVGALTQYIMGACCGLSTYRGQQNDGSNVPLAQPCVSYTVEQISSALLASGASSFGVPLANVYVERNGQHERLFGLGDEGGSGIDADAWVVSGQEEPAHMQYYPDWFGNFGR